MVGLIKHILQIQITNQDVLDLNQNVKTKFC